MNHSETLSDQYSVNDITLVARTDPLKCATIFKPY